MKVVKKKKALNESISMADLIVSFSTAAQEQRSFYSSLDISADKIVFTLMKGTIRVSISNKGVYISSKLREFYMSIPASSITYIGTEGGDVFIDTIAKGEITLNMD